MKSFRFLAAGLIGATLIASSGAQSLNLGSPAPQVKVAQWVKGTPIAKFQPGKVYVVEFWATWCGPCKVSIPHLTELAKKYAGKATFTGVSVWENQSSPTDTSYQAKVADFVREKGAVMDYNVATDGVDHAMATNWMQAAGENGIPCAFVINQKGQVAWIGHPMMGLDEAVGQILDGTYDLKAALATRTKAKAEIAARNLKLAPYVTAYRAKDWPKAVAALDKLFKTDPSFEPQLAMSKFSLLLKTDEPAGYAYAKQIANGVYKSEPAALNQISWMIVGGEVPLKQPDYALGLEVAKAAVELSHSNDANILDTLSVAQSKNGDVAGALETETKAVAVAENTPNFPAATLTELKTRLSALTAQKGR